MSQIDQIQFKFKFNLGNQFSRAFNFNLNLVSSSNNLQLNPMELRFFGYVSMYQYLMEE